MESKETSNKGDGTELFPPGGLLFLIALFMMIPGLAIIFIGRTAGVRSVSFVGFALICGFGLLAAFGFIRWQWGYFRELTSQREKLWYVFGVVFALGAGAFLDWLAAYWSH
jgi:amino acid permease